MENKIDNHVKRTYQYFYDDGLVEMAVGLLFTFTGLVLLAWQIYNESSWATIFLVAGSIIVVIGGAFLINWAVRELKQRFTYPRTGYVVYRQGEPSIGRWIIPLAALAMVATTLLLPETITSMSSMVGALLAAVMIVMGHRINLWRFYAVGFIALVSGLVLALSQVNELIAVSLTFGITGLAPFLAGAIGFVKYIRSHPEPLDDRS